MSEAKHYLDDNGLRILWNKLDERDQEIIAKILANTDAINLLNSIAEGDNPAPLGSVIRTVSDEIAKVIADAPEKFDTLKEISDWILNEPDGAAGMNNSIQTNKADIAKLKTLLSIIEESGTIKSTRLDNIETSINNIQEIPTSKIDEICIFDTIV